MKRKRQLTVSESGRLGGKASAAKLTAAERSDRARRAVAAREAKKKQQQIAPKQ